MLHLNFGYNPNRPHKGLFVICIGFYLNPKSPAIINYRGLKEGK